MSEATCREPPTVFGMTALAQAMLATRWVRPARHLIYAY